MSLPPLVAPVEALSDDERIRTARHTRLAGFGDDAQRRLRAAHIAVVGAGGLGSPVVLALAAAGVGTLTVVDDDVVELSNLQRQVIHRVADAGAPKLESVRRVAADLSPETTVRGIPDRLGGANARDLLAGADLVIDGTDTFETRRAVAAACEALGVPLVWGTVQGFDAQVTVFWSAPPPGVAPIVLDDLYPDGSVGEVPSCADVGVLGSLCLQVGSLLATEAVKLVTGVGEPLLGRILMIDALRARQSEVPLRGNGRASAPARASAPTPEPIRSITAVGPSALADTPVIDVREAAEVATGTIPGARHIPLAQLLADPGAIHGPVVIVCQTAVRSRIAAEALRTAGVEASILAGGMEAWTAAGAPVAPLAAS
jgi:adenylyltransferase/sulfurtransferase